VLSEAERFVWDYAKLLVKYKRTQTLSELADRLNSMGFRHANGAPFHGGQTTGNFLSNLYAKIEKFMGAEAAGPIAEAFTGADGEYCWDKPKPATAEVTQQWLDEQQASWQPAI
jgi:hypothetical protein